ncbi:hypothetical protein RIF29_00095 [Crotalaria pallida]|uniref:Reverse transcriptase zinc-binding domain-containing protein n=1 Tax=Crotalaria pallida TaxID=3830 RepID=A0AAN9IVI8_CROPI
MHVAAFYLSDTHCMPRELSEPICPCCGMEEEIVYHALVSCREVQEVWFASQFGIRIIDGGATVFGNWFQQKFLDSKNKEAIGMACEILWAIWNRRNSWVFNYQKQSMMQVLSHAMSIHSPLVMQNKPTAVRSLNWKPP